MKKTKFLKILAPIVALGLLIGALVGVSASANEADPATVTPEIISMNVEYGSELYLYYAVDKSTVSGTPSLEVLSDKDGSSVEYVVTEYTEEKVNGKDSYIFKTAGVAASDVNKVQFVRAADGDVKGAIREASVEMYLYAKLYKEGFAMKTAADGDDFVRRNLYFQLLNYAKFAQELFYYGTDYEAIGAPGIIVSGAEGLASGKYAGASDVLTLKASNKDGFSYFKVEEFTPFGEAIGTRLLADGFEYILDNSAKISAVYNAESMDGVEAWDSGVIHFNEMPSYAISTGNDPERPYVIGENTWGIAELEDGNRVLHIHKNCNGSLNPGYNDNNKTYNWGVSQVIPVTEKEENANVAIFEAKICYTNLTASAEAEISIRGSSTSKENVPVKYYLNANKANGSQFSFKPQTNGAGETAQTMTGAKVGTWFTFRIEYRTTEEGLNHKLYINDSLVYDGTNIYGTNIVSGKTAIPLASEISSVSFLVNNSVMGDVYFDDVSLKLIAE